MDQELDSKRLGFLHELVPKCVVRLGMDPVGIDAHVEAGADVRGFQVRRCVVPCRIAFRWFL
jgi:hypothetical protein